MRYLSVKESRQIDWLAKSQGHIPGLILMENAGRGVAEILLEKKIPGKVVICCGGGNNGGDGFVIARHLDGAGIKVEVLLFCKPGNLAGDAAVQFAAVSHATIPVTVMDDAKIDTLESYFTGAAWLVDALVGSGQSGALRSPINRVVEKMNASGLPILAVDIPSGLDGDSGQPFNPTVRAAITATMVTGKIGFQNPAAGPFLGEVRVVGIGLTASFLP